MQYLPESPHKCAHLLVIHSQFLQAAVAPSFASSSRVKLEHLSSFSMSSPSRPLSTSSRTSAPPAAASRVSPEEVQERYSDHFWRDPSAQSASSKRGGRRSSATKSTALGIERYAANGAVNDTTTRVKAGEKKSSLQSSGMASPISRAKTDVLDKNKARLPSARILSQRIATLQEVLEQGELVGAGAGAAGAGPAQSLFKQKRPRIAPGPLSLE